jgi:hypothetical protein
MKLHSGSLARTPLAGDHGRMRSSVFVLASLLFACGSSSTGNAPAASFAGGAGGTAGANSIGGSGGAAGAPIGAGGTQAMSCVPGVQVACACPGGLSGAQACNAMGSSFGACQCPSAAGGGGGTSVGAGGAAGMTSAAGTAGTSAGSGGMVAGGGAAGGASCPPPQAKIPHAPPGAVYCAAEGKPAAFCLADKERCCAGQPGEWVGCVSVGTSCPQMNPVEWMCTNDADCKAGGCHFPGPFKLLQGCSPTLETDQGTVCGGSGLIACQTPADCPPGAFVCQPMRTPLGQLGFCQMLRDQRFPVGQPHRDDARGRAIPHAGREHADVGLEGALPGVERAGRTGVAVGVRGAVHRGPG